MAWDDGLEGVHYEVAVETRSPVHVLAGPGTGKTYAMMRRIARLLEDDVTPERILAVTFTRTAARDLQEQLARLGVPGAEAVRASTLHSLCFSILAGQEAFVVTQRHARPLLSHEEDQLVNDLAEQFGGKREVRRLLKAYEAGWARLQRNEVRPPADPQDAVFEAALLNWLRYHQSILVGELVPLTLSFLRQNPAQQIAPVFEHVLVDEYQDLNRADQTLVLELARNASLTVIGDDNQSIYSFRFANPEAVVTFPEDHPDTARFTINECHRCPPNVVEMSNRLISQNRRRARQIALVGETNRPPAEVYIVQHESIEEEVESLADYIATYLARNRGTAPGQVLVLCTRRFLGHRIRRALIDRRLNAQGYFYEDELHTRSAAEGFTLLTLLVRPADRAALRAWIGLGSQSGYARSYRRVCEYAASNQQELRETLDQLASGVLKLPYCTPIAERHRELLRRLECLAGQTGLDLVRALWSLDDTESLDIRLAAEAIALEGPDPTSILDALARAITQPELPGATGDVIRIMSLYKSKGLTAALVVVAGCMAGALPTIDRDKSRPVQEAQLEEQRRLFYVAITRPTRTLVISSAVRLSLADAKRAGVEISRVFRSGRLTLAQTAASPFIAELGPAAPRPVTTGAWRRQTGIPVPAGS